MNAVDSEYKLGLKDDARREYDVIREIVDPGHPLAKLAVGNLQTPREGGGDIREDLLAFYAKHYSANQMTLVVLGREPLDQLQAMVSARFGAVENRRAKELTRVPPLFDRGTLPLELRIRPGQELRELTLLFPLPSQRAHYACLTVANWLGLGEENVIMVPATDDNEMQVDLLGPCLQQLVQEGRRIACIVATMGTTDAFGLDDLATIASTRDALVREHGLDYVPHIHADAVIGWAWSVFNDYDWDANPLGFRHRTVRALAGESRRIRHLGLADSVGVDFHKTGFAPYVSSAVLLKNRLDFAHLTRRDEDTPYIFQSGTRHPGKYTLETSRAGSGPLSALANLRLFGTRGLQALLGHLVTMAEELREQLEGHTATTVMNGDNFGPVTLFRV